MSWSFSMAGNALDVARAAQDQLPKFNCAQPEQGIKEAATKIIVDALGSMHEAQPVTVCANGHQFGDGKGKINNVVNLSISV